MYENDEGGQRDVAQNTERKGGSAIDGRTTRHVGYAISQRKRKMIETTFGWAKQYGGLRRMMYRGFDRVAAVVTFTVTVFNLLQSAIWSGNGKYEGNQGDKRLGTGKNSDRG